MRAEVLSNYSRISPNCQGSCECSGIIDVPKPIIEKKVVVKIQRISGRTFFAGYLGRDMFCSDTVLKTMQHRSITLTSMLHVQPDKQDGYHKEPQKLTHVLTSHSACQRAEDSVNEQSLLGDQRSSSFTEKTVSFIVAQFATWAAPFSATMCFAAPNEPFAS